jgi:hypothetical protein
MMAYTPETISADALPVAARAVTEIPTAPAQPSHDVPDAAAQNPVRHDHTKAAERKPEYLAMGLVRTDGGTQARAGINNATVDEYAEALRGGAKLPPVVLYHEKSADAYWLADGFHRVHAHRSIGSVDILAVVKDGTRRDAVLHAVGANASHGLRRTNADKRRAVAMLLADELWSQWSDREIARQCAVCAPLVADVRKAICNPVTDEPAAPAENAVAATRTVSRGGTAYQQKVGNIGKATKPSTKPATSMMTCTATASSADTLIVSEEMAALRAENAQLRAQLEDRDAQLEDSTSVNETLAAQLDRLSVQFEAALACHDEIRVVLEAGVLLNDAPRQLQQALELSRTLESRVVEAPRRYSDARHEEDRLTPLTESEATADGASFAELPEPVE